jgi:hypothetical protein
MYQPTPVQVFGDYKLLVKILSWISAIPGFPGFPKGTRGPLLVQLGGTCRGVRRAAAPLVDQRTIERIVALMPTWQWVDFSASYGQVGPAGPAGPDSGPEESTITSRVRALVRAQEPRWWVACPFRLHGLGGIARTSILKLRADEARRLLSLLSESRPEYSGLVGRLLDTKRPSVKAVESVEKLSELLLDPINPKNVQEYGATEAYDIRDLKSLTSLKFVRDTDVTFWDTSHVTDMSYMAKGLMHSLSGIEHWNTSRVTYMEGAFVYSGFNQDIGKWDVGRVENTSILFEGTPFNQDIGRWDTSSVKDMGGMFKGASAFNQDIGKWDVGQVITITEMFSGAQAFDRDISAWAVGSVLQASNLFKSCPIREAHIPPTGLAVRGPRATELRSELTRIIGELGLRHMSIVCVDTATGPIRVSLNRSIIGAAAAKLAPSSPKAESELRAKVQDQLLRCICGFYGWPGPEVPEAPKGPGKGPKGRVPVTVQFNWTAPLDRPRPWTWTCGSTEKPEPLEKPEQPEPEHSKCTVS